MAMFDHAMQVVCWSSEPRRRPRAVFEAARRLLQQALLPREF